MRFPLIGRRQETSEPPETPKTRDSSPTIDIKTPRECLYKTFAGNPGPCPRCGTLLQQSSQTYLIGTKRGRQIADSFMIGGDLGWLCPHCPTIVMNPKDVRGYLSYTRPGWDVGSDFAPLGIVDLDAIPSDKQHLPLGGDDNPIPLVQFTRVTGQQTADRSADQQGPHPSKHSGSKRRTSTAKKRRSR